MKSIEGSKFQKTVPNTAKCSIITLFKNYNQKKWYRAYFPATGSVQNPELQISPFVYNVLKDDNMYE